MGITIKKIAELCSTSRGTVDRVINKRGNVNPELEKRILEVMKEYNYKPNVTAKALVKFKKKRTIGVVINSIGNNFYDSVIEGINKAKEKVSDYNVDVIIKEIKGYDDKIQLEAICELERQKISGLVLTPVYSKIIIEKVNALKAKGIPTVFANADVDESNRFAVVSANNKKSGKIAAQIASLVLHEKSKIAIVTGSFNNLGHIKRIKGFEEIIKNSDKNIELISVMENNDDNEKSYNVVKRLIENNRKLDLIYFAAGGVQGGIQAICDSSADIHAITMDESEFIRDYIDRDIIYATITQQPFVQGYKPITMLADYLVLNIKPEKTKIHTESEILLKHSF